MVDVSAAARLMQVLWGAVCTAGVGVPILLAWVGTSQGAAQPDLADTAFYACALWSAVSLAIAFALLHRRDERLASTPSDVEALGLLRTHGLVALALVEGSALVAGVAALLTGNFMTLAFCVPLVAFALLTWPSVDRITALLERRTRG